MPGRYKSPVQQVWEYGMDTERCQFMLVSNMLEFRLYAVGHTRQVYERFDILELADSDAAYQRFRLLLSAENLLSGATAKLLSENAQAEKAITQQLYSDYNTWRVSLLLALMQSNARGVETIIELVQKLLVNRACIKATQGVRFTTSAVLAKRVAGPHLSTERPIFFR